MIVIPYLSDGGAERVASLWANYIATTDNDVKLLTYYKVDNEYTLDERVKRVNLTKNKESYNKISFFKKVRMIRNEICTYNPDVIIPFLSHTNIAVSLANKNKNCQVFQTIRNNPWVNPDKKMFRILRDFFIKKEKKVIVQNEEQASYFKSKKIKKYVVCNPVNPKISEIVKTNYQKIEKIVAVGRLHSQKNYPLMIKTIGLLLSKYKMNIKLDIYGDGPDAQLIQSEINNSKLNDYVTLKGRTSNILEIEKKYDAFLMTSNYEGFPNALLEAMAIGLPVFSTNCKTGPKNLINNNINGILIDAFDPEAIAKIIYDNNNQEKLEKMGKKARDDVFNKYSMEMSMKQLMNVISYE